MQVVVRIASTGQSSGSTVRETTFSSPRKDIGFSQETSANLPLTKCETVDERTHSERNTQDCRERSTDQVSRSTTNASHFIKLFRKKKTKRTRLKKACEVVFLASVIVATVSVQAVPTIVYFAKGVSPYAWMQHAVTEVLVQNMHALLKMLKEVYFK